MSDEPKTPAVQLGEALEKANEENLRLRAAFEHTSNALKEMSNILDVLSKVAAGFADKDKPLPMAPNLRFVVGVPVMQTREEK